MDAFLSAVDTTESEKEVTPPPPVSVSTAAAATVPVTDSKSSGSSSVTAAGGDDEDMLAGFFSELTEVAKEKERVQEEKSVQARDLLLTEKYTTQDLGTGKEQYARLAQPNYLWKNQNPYAVMQLGIDATEEDVKYR